MRGNRDIFSGKSIYNRETINRQDHRIGEYHIYPTPPLGQDMTQGQFF